MIDVGLPRTYRKILNIEENKENLNKLLSVRRVNLDVHFIPDTTQYSDQ
jgi:hypothetical protein